MDADDLVQPIRDEVGARRAVDVVHLVDARVANREQRRRRRRGGAQIDAAARRDVVARVERAEEVVLLDDPGDGERRRRREAFDVRVVIDLHQERAGAVADRGECVDRLRRRRDRA